MRLFSNALASLAAAAMIGGAGCASAADLKPVPGFDGTTITIGELLPLTGPAANFGPAVANGSKAWIEYLNKEKGGIAGRYKLALAIEDNANEQTMTVQSYNKIKGQVAMISMLFGTHTTLAVLPQIVEDKLMASVVGADEQFYRQRNLLPVGSTYQVIVINALDYITRERGAQDKVFCGMFRDDPYGQASLGGFKFATEKLKLKVGVMTSFTLTDQDFSGQVGQLKGANCDYVYATTIPPQLVRMVGNMVRVGYQPTMVVPFPSWTGALVGSPAIDYFEQHLLIAGEGTEWGDVSSPQMAQMIDNLKKYTPDQKPDFFYVLGYRCTMASTNILEKAAASGDISREALLKALESTSVMDFGGTRRRAPLWTRKRPPGATRDLGVQGQPAEALRAGSREVQLQLADGRVIQPAMTITSGGAAPSGAGRLSQCFLGSPERAHAGRAAAIQRDVQEHLADLLCGDAVAQRALDMLLELGRPVERCDQRDRDHAADLDREARPGPYAAIAERGHQFLQRPVEIVGGRECVADIGVAEQFLARRESLFEEPRHI